MKKGMQIKPTKRIWQGIPGIEKTAKGRLFVTWFSGGAKEPEPENTIYLCTSDDGGQTFTEPAAVVLPTGQARAFDPTLWIDPAGKLWLIFDQSMTYFDGRAGNWYTRCDYPSAFGEWDLHGLWKCIAQGVRWCAAAVQLLPWGWSFCLRMVFFFVFNGLIAYIGKAAHIGGVSWLGSIRTPCDFDLLRPVTVMRCREMSGRNAEQPAEGF